MIHVIALAAVVIGSDPALELNRLYEDYQAWRLRESPEMAMSNGDYSNADHLSDMSLEAVHRRQEQTREFLNRLHQIPAGELDERSLISREVFDLMLTTEVAGYQYRTELMPIGARFGPHLAVPQMHERVRFDSVKDYEDYLQRLRGVPKMVDDLIQTLKTGLAEGRTPPRVTMESIPDQFRAILSGGGLDGLTQPLLRFPACVDEANRNEIADQLKQDVIPTVRGALERLGDFVTKEYLPGCRPTIAAKDLPDGEAYYAWRLRDETTSELSANYIHRIGTREVARIRDEMLKVIARTDFKEKNPESAELEGDELFKAFVNYLRTSPRFYYTREEDLLTGYREICKRIDAELPRVFQTLPRLPYGVRPVPKFMAPMQTTAYYQNGDIRNRESGVFYANTYALDQRPKYEMIPLALHESVPGHHLQIALAQEIEGIPEFRKHTGFTAFVEGWGLYSESLGLEMGLYSDPYDDFGRLLYEMWRSCRLVVDTGVHALGWTRDQAIVYMRDNTALSELNIQTEVDRYISWPGQATGYKIGQLEIKRLREKAADALGDTFDLREFHDVVLLEGAVPISILERRVNEWVAKKRAAQPSR